MKITVVGQGYVGLPLAIAAVNAGYTVYGLDNNEDRIKSLAMALVAPSMAIFIVSPPFLVGVLRH